MLFISWSNYEEALKLLKNSNLEYEYIGGCSDLIIEKAESILGIRFSKIFKHFIKKYGAGIFATYEILGIIDENYSVLSNMTDLDALQFTLKKRKVNKLPTNFIPIIAYDSDILYCLDFNKLNLDNEPAVVAFNIGEDWGEKEIISEDFGEFLLDIINDEIEALKLCPIEIIYDVEALKGSCYVEIYPGIHTGNHWNKESIYFSDETFTYISPSIEKFYNNYSLYGLSEIDNKTWSLIISDLEKLKIFLKDNPNETQLKKKIRFLTEDKTEKQFIENLSENILDLINLITDFQLWIYEKCKNQEYISILGI